MLFVLMMAAPSFGQSSPPLLTDDPGTPGPNNWEINIGMTADRRVAEREFEVPLFDANYGVGERIQLKFEIPYMLHRASSENIRMGLGNSLMGVKWRFYEEKEHEFAISVYPQFGFNNPTHSVSRGVADPGKSLLLPVEITRKFGSFTLEGELGYNFAQRRPDNWIAGFAMGHPITTRLEFDAELYRDANVGTSSFSNNTFDFGGHYELRKSVLLLFMAGRSFSAPSSGQSQLIGYFGFQFLIGKQHEE